MLADDFRNAFRIHYLDKFMDLFEEIKSNYKLLGFMDNSRVDKFVNIVMDNLKFNDMDTDSDDSDDESDIDIS